MKVLIRADAGPKIGMGHVMRCYALAQALIDAGHMAAFLSRGLPPEYAARLEREGIAVLAAKFEPGSDEDRRQTIRVLAELQADWALLDSYALSDAYVAGVRAVRPVLLIDDCADRDRYDADIVLNQNLGANNRDYAVRAGEAVLLLGTQYGLLRREFTALPAATARRDVGLQVLITLGGSDPADLTCTAMRAFMTAAGPMDRAVVIVGAANPRLRAIEEEARRLSTRIAVRVAVDDMAEWMVSSDVAIAAAGSTCWELARTGLPAVLLVAAENQRRSAQAMNTAGTAIAIEGAADGEQQIGAALAALMRDSARRAAMSAQLREMVDGRGAQRVVLEMERRFETAGGQAR